MTEIQHKFSSAGHSRKGTHRIARFLHSCIKLFIGTFNSYVPLPKSETPSRIISNAQLYDFALEEKDMAELDALDRESAGSVSWNPVGVP